MSSLLGLSPHLKVSHLCHCPVHTTPSTSNLPPFVVSPLLCPWDYNKITLPIGVPATPTLPVSQSVGHLIYDRAMFLLKKNQSNSYVHSKQQVLVVAVKDCPLPTSPALFLKYGLL